MSQHGKWLPPEHQCLPVFIFFFTILNQSFKRFFFSLCKKNREQIQNLHCEVEFVMNSTKVVCDFLSSSKIRRTLQKRGTLKNYIIMCPISKHITPFFKKKKSIFFQNTQNTRRTGKNWKDTLQANTNLRNNRTQCLRNLLSNQCKMYAVCFPTVRQLLPLPSAAKQQMQPKKSPVHQTREHQMAHLSLAS